MANEGGGENGGGEETTLSSPKNRVKFLCSHGGRIIPRPIDGQLKYVGGETRVIAIPRDVTFSELMTKLSAKFDSRDKVLKYQLITEDLDALVSVRSDEDLKHMLEEHDRHENEGTPKLRAFLFPSNPVVVDQNQTAAAAAAASIEQLQNALEQRYVDALNGVVRTTFRSKLKPIKASHSNFNNISLSACSSPHCSSPEGQTIDHQNNGRIPAPIHKVQSSPTLYSYNNSQHYNNTTGALGSSHHHNHHYNYPNHQLHHNHGYHLRPPSDPQKGVGSTERLAPLPTNLSFRADNGRNQCRGQGFNYHFYPSTRYHREHSGGCNAGGYYDECGVCGYPRLDRSGSLPRSPGKIIWE